jgi:hypothetical protein
MSKGFILNEGAAGPWTLQYGGRHAAAAILEALAARSRP